MIHCNNCEDPQMCMDRGACMNGWEALNMEDWRNTRILEENNTLLNVPVRKIVVRAEGNNPWGDNINNHLDNNGIDVIN